MLWGNCVLRWMSQTLVQQNKLNWASRKKSVILVIFPDQRFIILFHERGNMFFFTPYHTPSFIFSIWVLLPCFFLHIVSNINDCFKVSFSFALITIITIDTELLNRHGRYDILSLQVTMTSKRMWKHADLNREMDQSHSIVSLLLSISTHNVSDGGSYVFNTG